MLIFLSHPIQYVSPLLRKLSGETDLMVYYYGGQSISNIDSGFGQRVTWDIPLLEGYEYHFLTNRSKSSGMNNRFFDAVNFDIFGVLRNSNDDVIVLNGWSYLSDWFVLFAAKLYRKKVLMRSEMPWNQEKMKPISLRNSIKLFIFKNIVFNYFIDSFLYIGSQNKEYYYNLGVQNHRLIYAPYAVDNKRFKMQVTNSVLSRSKWGIPPNAVIILFSGKLIEKKRPMDLLRVVHNINNSDIFLFYMGDGPLRKSLESYVEKYELTNVIISGFINQSEIATIYSMADIFVMCSGIGETWGLSVNEAMNFSLPIVISTTCGSSYDLVEDNENGFKYVEGDIAVLMTQINKLVDDKYLRIRMGKSSMVKVDEFDYNVTCRNICEYLSRI